MARLLRMFRHYETPSNREGLFGDGPKDNDPSEKGLSQAEALADHIDQFRGQLGQIWTGTSFRSRETGRIALREEIPWQPDYAHEGLNELSVGRWSGLSKNDLSSEDLAAWREGTLLPPGGDSPEEFDARVMGAYEAIVAKLDEGEDVTVFTSGNPIRFFLGQAFKTPWRNLLPVMSIDNCGMTTFQRKGGKWVVVTVNGINHLGNVGVSALPGT